MSLRRARSGLLRGAACSVLLASVAVTPALLASGNSPASGAAPPVVVTNLNSSGVGSLRAAINQVNASFPGSSSTINFAVHGVITLASGLPPIRRAVSIDARSAPTYVAGGAPVVEIDCNGSAGITFAPGSDSSQLLGVAVDDAVGNGVALVASSITVNNDYVGLESTGGAYGNRGAGIYVFGSSSKDLIGLNPSGVSGVVGNVISGNAGSGIVLDGSSGDTVAANRIGTDPSGAAAIANGGDGISLVNQANGNEIGGTQYVDNGTGQANNPTGSKGTVPAVFVVPPLGNQISGNVGNGVSINSNSQRNSLNGNFIGTTADGDGALANGGDGVSIVDANRNSLTGCKFVNDPFVYYNVVSANGNNGLHITDSNDTTVQGNFFGIGADNATLLGNRADGILVDGSSSDVQVGGVIPLGNVSAGNGANGIEVSGTVSGFTTFNTFGGLLAFEGAAANGNDGLLITSTGGNNLVRTNVFSGNTGNGIEIGGDASGVTVDPDIAGLTTKGDASLPNGGDGLLIDGTAHGNTVGGSLSSVIPQDTFSGNGGYGLAIVDQAHDNRIFGAFIGTDVMGTAKQPNQQGGILVTGTATRNTIGGLLSSSSNLVSGNNGPGIRLDQQTRLNVVIRNTVGRGRLGLPLPNSGPAIINSGVFNAIVGNTTYP